MRICKVCSQQLEESVPLGTDLKVLVCVNCRMFWAVDEAGELLDTVPDYNIPPGGHSARSFPPPSEN